MNEDPHVAPPSLEPPPAAKLPLRENYYHGVLRWRVWPPFVVVLLALWAWTIYSGFTYQPGPEYNETTSSLALNHLDRELRIAEALQGKPAALHWFLWRGSQQDTFTYSLECLSALEKITPLCEHGDLARTIIQRHLGIDPETSSLVDTENQYDETLKTIRAYLNEDFVYWWNHETIDTAASDLPPDLIAKLRAQDQRLNQTLLTRTIGANVLSWTIFLIGLFYIPTTWRTLRAGLKKPLPTTHRYGWGWPTSLILALFAITDLLGDWFYSLIYQFTPLPLLTFGFDVTVDFLWRFIPISLLLFILFRKPRHLIRSFGLDRMPDWKLIFGLFAILGIIDIGLYNLISPFIETDPTRGLHGMENGWAGLFYGLLSACIAAPIAEELIYRGTLLRGIHTSRGFWAAALLSTLAFAVMHYYDAYGTISVAIFGLSAALLYRATGSLVHAIALHALYNFSITSLTWLIYHSPL